MTFIEHTKLYEYQPKRIMPTHFHKFFFANFLQQINARAEVLRMERELEEARKKLTIVNQRRYQTDSEQSEQSG